MNTVSFLHSADEASKRSSNFQAFKEKLHEAVQTNSTANIVAALKSCPHLVKAVCPSSNSSGGQNGASNQGSSMNYNNNFCSSVLRIHYLNADGGRFMNCERTARSKTAKSVVKHFTAPANFEFSIVGDIVVSFNAQ